MFLLDSLLIDGLHFVFDKIQVAADAAADDDVARLREKLLEGQTQLEAGEISDTEYDALERDVLERLSAARHRQRGENVATADYKVTGADVRVTHDEDDQR